MTDASPAADAQSWRLPYLPALDGIRGVAVIAVLLFHAGYGWAKGGFLGVTVFFVLSGFLITGLLLSERDTTGRVSLKKFWGRRARRLVPAVLVLILIVIAFAAWANRRPPPGLMGDGVATLAWVANWRFVFAHRAYAALFGSPSPLQHMWSLAVEEQFYLVFPLVLALMVRRGRGRARRWPLALVVGAGVGASSAAAWLLHVPGATGRAYFGTDARVAEPLVGVLLALLLVRSNGLTSVRRRLGLLLDVIGVASFAGLAYLVVTLAEQDQGLYHGGFLLAAVLSAGLVAAASQGTTLVSKVLAVRPLVGLGKISYGIYLFHWPIFLWLTPRRTGLQRLPLLGFRSTATIAVACISYILIERPVRIGDLRARVGLVGWADLSVGLVAGLAVATATVPGGGVALSRSSLMSSGPYAQRSAIAPAHAPMAAHSTPVGAVPVSSSAAASTPPAPVATTTPGPHVAHSSATTTSTTSPPGLKVAFVGDSMAEDLADGFERWASAQRQGTAYNFGIPGCPLSRGGSHRTPDGNATPIQDGCDWWSDPSSNGWSAFVSVDPDVVVVQDGLNEVPDRKIPAWSDYKRPGDPQFDSWLLSEYSAVIKKVSSLGAKVLVLNAVCADWDLIGGAWSDYSIAGDGDNRVFALDRTDQGTTTAGAQMADFQSHLCPNGKFSQSVDGVNNARPDGYHLTSDAAEAVADRWLGPLVVQASKRKNGL